MASTLAAFTETRAQLEKAKEANTKEEKLIILDNVKTLLEKDASPLLQLIETGEPLIDKVLEFAGIPDIEIKRWVCHCITDSILSLAKISLDHGVEGKIKKYGLIFSSFLFLLVNFI